MVKTIFITLVLVFGLVGLTSADCTDSHYYLLKMKYVGGNLTILEKSLQQGCPPPDLKMGNAYNANIIEGGGKPLSGYSFIPNIMYTDIEVDVKGGATVELNESIFTIALPYSKSSKSAVITDPNGKVVAKTNVSGLEPKQPSFDKGQTVPFIIKPSNSGFFEKVYFYKDNSLLYVKALGCNEICYGTKVFHHTIPYSWEGKIKMLVYDYRVGEWVDETFLVSAQNTDKLELDLRHNLITGKVVAWQDTGGINYKVVLPILCIFIFGFFCRKVGWKRSKKGISPLIATVLIIGFTVALAAVIMTWGKGFTSSLGESNEAKLQRVQECAKLSFEIKNACSSKGKVTFTITNSGNKDISSNSQIRLEGKSNSNIIPFPPLSSINSFGARTISIESTLTDLITITIIPKIKIDGKEVVCENSFVSYKDVEVCTEKAKS